MKKPRLITALPSGTECATCPYQETSRGYTSPQLRPNSIYAFLGEASGYWEILEGTPFAGKSGGKLQSFFDLAHLSRLDVSILNPIRCRPIRWDDCKECGGAGDFIGSPDSDVVCMECKGEGKVEYIQRDGDNSNAKPEQGQIIECMRRYGHETLRGLDKKQLIIAMGSVPTFALLGRDDVGTLRGHVMDSDHGRVLVTYHPSFIMRDAGEAMEPAVRRDFERIPKIASRVEGSGLEVNYVKEPSKEVIRDLWRTKRDVVVDLETAGGKDPDTGGDILIAGVSRKPGEGIIIEAGSPLRIFMANLEGVVGQYFYSYDAWWLFKRGYNVPGQIVDTQVLGHLADPSSPNDLPTLQSIYATPPMEGYWKDKSHYEGDLALVACRDADSTKRTEIGLRKYLAGTGQWGLAEDVVIPWCRLAFELRRDGIRCNNDLLREEAERISEEVFTGGSQLAGSTGVSLPKKTKTGLPSYPAIQRYLYGDLGLPKQYHRKTGKVTTDEPHLKKLRTWCWNNGHKEGLHFIDTFIGRPDPDNPGEWMMGLKQKSTQAKDFRKFGKFGDRIHAEPNLTGTVTGRLSYLRPNLQQVPPRCKKAFLPDEGHVFIEWDFKQVEFLIMLYKAQQWDLLKACLGGLDGHTMVAKLFYNRTRVAKDSPLRKKAKALNFGMIFGKGEKTLAEDLGITEKEAGEMFDRYYEIIPGLEPMRKALVQGVKTRGYHQTEYGWRRNFTSEEKRKKTEIYNMPMQSLAGIHTRKALVDLWRELPSEARLVLTVHDSGLVSTPGECAPRVVECIRDVVTRSCKVLPCPEIGMPEGLRFQVDITVGKNWGEMKPWTKA